jgi:protein-tyrosine phosphatase
MRLLFVCSGNICRSPMAAEYMRHRAARSGLAHVVVDSRGTLGIEGHPASPEACQAMSEIGLDLTRHRSRGIDEAALRAADVVVAMSHHHLVELAEAYPAKLGGERLLLRAFEAGPAPHAAPADLDDPIGCAVEAYREQRAIIVRAIDHLALWLKHAR